MRKLTLSNYFSPTNTRISNSKLNDFRASPTLFYRKHILHEISTTLTPEMKIGAIVDANLSGTSHPFQVKVLKRENESLFRAQKNITEDVFVTKAQAEEAEERTNYVLNTPAYAWYKANDAEFQVVLEGEIIGVPMCGLADVITKTPDTIYLDDFKSVSKLKVANPKKWLLNCLEMGYIRQLALYRELYKQMNPDEKRPIICRHFVVTKLVDHAYTVRLFVFEEDLLRNAMEEIEETLHSLLERIATNDFEDKHTDWSSAVHLGGYAQD